MQQASQKRTKSTCLTETLMEKTIDDRFAALLHHRAAHLGKGEPLAPPIVSAATYHLPEVEGASHVYGRSSMPTWDGLEDQIAILEDAPTLALPSGMAAIAAALFATLGAGRKAIIPSDGYYTTRSLAERFLKPYGVEIVEVPTVAMAEADVTGADVVFVETPSNPGLEVCDIAAVATRVHLAGGLLVVDNTTMTPALQRPLDLGADIVVAADTKAPSGHGDVLFGHLSTRNDTLMQAARDWRKLTGAVPGAFEAWLVHRGMETLDVRLERMCRSAGVIAERLVAHPSVLSVRYPGLKDDKSHAIASRQMSGFGFLVSFILRDAETAERFLSTCPYIAQTTSFGGTHTSGERRARWGDRVPEGFIRLSVGCEPLGPLWTAIDEALKQ